MLKMLTEMQVSFLSLCQQIECWPEKPGLGITPEHLTLPQTPHYQICRDSSIRFKTKLGTSKIITWQWQHQVRELLSGHSCALKVQGQLDSLDSALRGFLCLPFFFLPHSSSQDQGTSSASSVQTGGFYVGIIERSKQYGAITISLFQEF